jgi:uncharacterized membrane protein YidH (DUF202 family)
MTTQNNHDESVKQDGGSISNTNRTIIHDKSRTFIIAILVAFNTLATVTMYYKWRDAERETRMQEYYLLELDAKFIGAGLKKPEESIAKRQGARP